MDLVGIALCRSQNSIELDERLFCGLGVGAVIRDVRPLLDLLERRGDVDGEWSGRNSLVETLDGITLLRRGWRFVDCAAVERHICASAADENKNDSNACEQRRPAAPRGRLLRQHRR